MSFLDEMKNNVNNVIKQSSLNGGSKLKKNKKDKKEKKDKKDKKDKSNKKDKSDKKVVKYNTNDNRIPVGYISHTIIKDREIITERKPIYKKDNMIKNIIKQNNNFIKNIF